MIVQNVSASRVNAALRLRAANAAADRVHFGLITPSFVLPPQGGGGSVKREILLYTLKSSVLPTPLERI